MSLRVYICPWIGSGGKSDPYRSKAATFAGLTATSYLPNKLDGTPASPWVLSMVKGTDFSAIDADVTCDDLFAGDLPPTVQTKDDIVALLRGRTVGDVALARRNAITAVLDKYTVPRADIVLATPLWKVFQRVTSTLFEKDDNFGSGF